MLKRCASSATLCKRVSNNVLYCGIEAVNSVIAALIMPAKKKKIRIIKPKSKLIAMPSGIPRLVICLIIGEQIIAIKSDNKNGMIISPESLTPARMIIIAAIATKMFVKEVCCSIMFSKVKREYHYSRAFSISG